MVEEGVRKPLLCDDPFRSSISTGAYKKEAERALENMGERIKLSFAEGWHIHPLFLEAIAGRIEEGLGQFDPEERRGVHLIFTSTVFQNRPWKRTLTSGHGRDGERCS